MPRVDRNVHDRHTIDIPPHSRSPPSERVDDVRSLPRNLLTQRRHEPRSFDIVDVRGLAGDDGGQPTTGVVDSGRRAAAEPTHGDIPWCTNNVRWHGRL